MSGAGRTVAVVGGGWAGLAAAVEATLLGHRVTLFEMAPQPGGRAREVRAGDLPLDNGQHILIGAYTETLRLMRTVGVDLDTALLRMPLCVTYPDGTGLQLGRGPAAIAFATAVLRQRHWRWQDRLTLLHAAVAWSLAGFRCPAHLTVAELGARLPARVRIDLIDPLCVAALNTPADDASASVFLRVLKDALFSGAGSADLLLPRASLSEIFPAPAMRWLVASGGTVRCAQRVQRIEADADRWHVDGVAFDRVVLAASPLEAARLVQPVSPSWSERAAGLRHEPIVTVYLQSEGCRLPAAMMALHSDASSPAQFVFDRGQLGGPTGLLAFVASGAQGWAERGQEATAQAAMAQALGCLGPWLRGPLQMRLAITERRATFRCTPGLARPPADIAAGLQAAGDHVAGPYPATLEGAVRSGVAAARALR